MSISILGAGNVGMALGRAFTRRGESVGLGMSEPARYGDVVARLGTLARMVTPAETIVAPGLAGLICGDDAQARQRLMALAALIGFDAVDLGRCPPPVI